MASCETAALEDAEVGGCKIAAERIQLKALFPFQRGTEQALLPAVLQLGGTYLEIGICVEYYFSSRVFSLLFGCQIGNR